MSAPDIDATVTRCRELAEFMRKQGAVTGAEAFEEAAAALLALRAELAAEKAMHRLSLDDAHAECEKLEAERDALRESLQFPTAKQCDAVLDSLLENEWTGITRDDVRMWCRFISDALAPADQHNTGNSHHE